MQTIVRVGVGLLYQAIPDELQDRLIQLGENISLSKWEIGDIANEIKELVRERLLNCSVMDVYTFVAQLLRDEFSARTIEYYAGLSGFYGVSIREEFQPLSHSHFAYARQHGDNWLAVLNLALDELGRTGKVPSVAKVDFIYMKRGSQITIPEPDPEPDYSLTPGAESSPETVATDYISTVVLVPIKVAINALETTVRLLGGIGMVEQANKLQAILDELHKSVDNLVNSC